MTKSKTDDIDVSDTPVSHKGAPPPAAPSTPAKPPKIGDAPSVGRIVHFIDRERAVSEARAADARGLDVPTTFTPHAAIITEINDALGIVSLIVFDPELGPQVVRDVTQAEKLTPARWSWPARV